MTKLPDVLFIVDPTKDMIALREARRVGIHVIGICDTNCHPDEIDQIVPANDDAIRAVKLLCSKIADAVIEGKTGQMVTAKVEGAEPAAEGAPVTQPTEPLGLHP